MTSRFVARQLSKPTGLLGRIVAAAMNRGNARLNEFALEQLGCSDTDRVLEVGFGGGSALEKLLTQVAFVCGVDRSTSVVENANRKFVGAVRDGRAEFLVGTVEKLPLSNATFDKALSVHTVYFWWSLDAGAAELARVLRPGGQVVLGFLPKARMERMSMPPDIFTTREPEHVLAALEAAGFRQSELRRSPASPTLVVTGLRADE